MITTNLSTLKIHKLTQEQYNKELTLGNIDENALYLTSEDSRSVQTDWSQNDETKSDYIKNRTHYFNKELIAEHTVMDRLETIILEPPLPLEDVNKLVIYFDGKELEYTVHNSGSIYDKDGCCVLFSSLGASDGDVDAYDITDSVPIGTHIEIYLQELKQLDEVFIPDSIARVSDVEEMIGMVNNALESILAGGVD